ncbi:MAG: ABC transporter ATP-binding protein [Gammaproteobacteria bacterium]|nr:ABC transporter ATP-binding protein [Gammaproteobacteria bacterium]
MSLELVGVSKQFEGQQHIYPTNLTLEKGTMNVLLGRTLSGKTSLMRLMAGLDAPSAGSLYWDGVDVTGQRVQDRNVAMVYQQFINYPSMSVFDNIASPLRLRGMSATEIERKVHDVAELMQLSPMLKRKPLELSGGQQQRCALARALVKGAGLVLLDEPLANLDYKLREELRVEIPKIFEASGAIFVYATTEPEEALLLGGNTATLHEGKITQFGSTPSVFRAPINIQTAEVFSDPPMNFTRVNKQGAQLKFTCGAVLECTGDMAALADGEYVAGVRADHIEITEKGEASLRFDATLAVTELTGSETFLHLNVDDQAWVGLVSGVHYPRPGQPLAVYIEPRHLYLFAANGQLALPAAYASVA